uniref:Uncharacterized protein n=1 Tax=Chryseobacterium endophyticum TaxID=1854762 RepID=A0AAU6WLX0_9FLAO
MENNSIDKTFNEASKTLEEPATFPGFDKVWAKVEEKLDKKEEKKRKGMGLWIPYGIAASLLIGSGIFYFTSESETPAVPKQAMAQQILAPKSQQAEISANIRKTDNIVKANIQKEIFKAPTAKIAYRKVPEIAVLNAVARVSDMPLPQVFPKETTAVAEDKIITDTEKRYHAEEVIATGIRKEKSSMVQALAANSTVKRKYTNSMPLPIPLKLYIRRPYLTATNLCRNLKSWLIIKDILRRTTLLPIISPVPETGLETKKLPP